MRFGFVVPYADAREFAELAELGERHGWDGLLPQVPVGTHFAPTLGPVLTARRLEPSGRSSTGGATRKPSALGAVG